jgi:anti-sigma regulatory factor (Ser/Thr protein kinase)
MSSEDIRLDVTADPKLLRYVRTLLKSYVIGQGFPEEHAENVVLAVDEACTNAIRHSYGGCCGEKVELRLGSTPDGVEIVVSDRGTPAPPGAVTRKESPPPDPASLKPGGLGVQLMFRVFDEVDFRPGETRGNTVRMLLRWPDGARRQAGAAGDGGHR